MLIPAKFRPGIFKEASDLGAGDVARWADGNLVRFWKGQPEPVGGWQMQNYVGTILGVPRALKDWVAIDDHESIGVGTNLKVYVYHQGTFYDVTPEADSGTLGANPFTTTNNESTVSVSDTTHGITAVNTYARFGTAAGTGAATTFNGVDMNGEFPVTEITDSDNFVVETSQTATATGTGGGTGVDFAYDIDVGPADGFGGLGWGASTWGSEAWGTERSVSATFINPRLWSIDTWGEDMVFCHRNGAIYLWDHSAGPTTRATQITQAPSENHKVLVSPHTRHMIALGAHDGSAHDPMLIRWCSQNDYTDWTASETNTAGDHRLDQGSKIIGGLNMANGDIAILTDDAMYAMQYIQPPYVFRVDLVGTSCGLIGPNAVTSWADYVYYMGSHNFFVYDGRVRVLPCDVESYVFDDMNRNQAYKFFAVVNSEFQEIMWFYASASSIEIDRYVSYNWKENTWNIGELSRTTMAPLSEIFDRMYGFDSSASLFTHEETVTPPSGVFLESGDIQIDRGDQFMFIDRIIPDFERNTTVEGPVTITLTGKRYPQDTIDPISKGPYNLTSSTKKIDLRLRARQVKIRLDSDAVDWRLSGLRLNVEPDGDR